MSPLDLDVTWFFRALRASAARRVEHSKWDRGVTTKF